MCVNSKGRHAGREQDGWVGILEGPEGKTVLNLPVVPFPQRQARTGDGDTGKRKLVEMEGMTTLSLDKEVCGLHKCG